MHFTSNETIHGVQYLDLPDASARRRSSCDMSSDFLWRKPSTCRRSPSIYAGAQKNIGPSGVTRGAREEGLRRAGPEGHAQASSSTATHAEDNSLYNTPPTFGIYLVRNVLAWTKEHRRARRASSERNREKARRSTPRSTRDPDFYRCPVEKGSRSVMNVVFRLPTEELEKKFVAEAKKRKMVGLKGHRSVGGIRASLYNAVERGVGEGARGLMNDFAKANG